MLTWPERATLHAWLDDPEMKFAGMALMVFGLLTVAVSLLAALIVPPVFQWFLHTYLVVLSMCAAVWMTLHTRLWLTLLIGTTVWSLGMVALFSLLKCTG